MRREEMAACGVRLSLVYVTAPPPFRLRERREQSR